MERVFGIASSYGILDLDIVPVYVHLCMQVYQEMFECPH